MTTADPNDDQRIAAARDRWMAAAHAMQTGVRTEMETGCRHAETEPKHLRVGVNTALRDTASLVGLLVRKGVITEVEYMEAIADGMEEEKRGYEQRLTEHFGRPVNLI